MALTVATCQFAVSSDVAANLTAVCDLMQAAKARGADVAHFPEAALSGYAGVDFPSFEGFDWPALKAATLAAADMARQLSLWMVLGSAHPLTWPHKPHNCAYIIDDQGRIIDRYDKRFCAGDAAGLTGDLAHYAPGDHFAVFEIKGVRCGVLICHDYRYPELYRQYQRRGVRLMFHGYHAGGLSPERHARMLDEVGRGNRFLGAGGTLPAVTMPAGMIASASNNHMWISCPNTSATISCWPGFFVRPDGVISGALEPEIPGVLISTVDPEAAFYDSTAAWRDRAIGGRLHSGERVADARSSARTEP
jgi:predicted amidohydrolase